MSTGIILPSLLSIGASAAETLVFSAQANQSDSQGTPVNGPWTPPQYSQPALTIITTPIVQSTTSGQPDTLQINYVFDAVFRVVHERKVHKTSHPILTGANLSDHAYVEPARVTLEIGMSDVMASYKRSVWTGASTKSISAWLIFKNLQVAKTPLVLTTRLDTYINMIITSIISPDDNKTKFGLRATIVLEELLTAGVSSVASASARPQTTNSTPGGTVQAIVPNGSQVQQFQIPSPLYPNVQTYPSVPGAGTVSSNSLSNLQ